MRKPLVFMFLISVIICLISGCKRDFGTFYDPPKGQESTIYKQLVNNPKLSTFVSAIDSVPGLKNELNSSGLFTIMAPDNDAFAKFFEEHPNYKLNVIPADTLALIVKYHILKWMLFQVNFLNPGLTKDNFNAYKYETRASLVYRSAGGRKLIYYPSKMIQVYTPNYFSLYHVTPQDYTDVFGPKSSVAIESQLNVMESTVTKWDISAGNGVIHIIDKVLLPPPTFVQLLDKESEYADFNQLMKNRFLTYSYNQSATIQQGNRGDINGDGLVDSLWNRVYSFNPDLDNENPKKPGTLTPFSMTAFAPSKSAFLDYLNNNLIKGFVNSVDSIPNRTLLLLYNTYFSQNMYWPSQLAGGVSSLNNDNVVISNSDINKIKMASNGIFYELNKVILPNAFTAVTGPAFLSLKYWFFGEMLNLTGNLSGLTKAGTKYTILCPTNQAFLHYGIYYDAYPTSGSPGFKRIIPPATIGTSLSTAQLAQLVGNHILTNLDLPAAKITDDFYTTSNNSIIVVEGGKIHGSVRDTVPQIIDPDNHMSNGYFHGIDKVIINPQQSIYDKINVTSAWNSTTFPLVTPEYTKFKELVIAAGIQIKDFGNITQVDEDRKFTLFVPSNDVITTAQVAGILPKTGAVTPNEPNTTGVITDLTKRARLESYIRYFFVQDKQCFTDGKTLGTFVTSKKDPISTPTNVVYILATITYPGSILTFNEIGTSTTGKVVTTNPVLYPQNTILKDGVIQIINNAFTSKY